MSDPDETRSSTEALGVGWVVIEPRPGWRPVDWRELVAYRDLFGFLVWRGIKARYAQSALGIGWAVIQPVVSMLVFTVIFGRLVGVKSEGAPYGIFAFVALVPWTYFANALSDAIASLVTNAQIIGKVYFPRMILPLSAVLARLVDFGIASVLLALMLAFAGIVPGPGVVVLPLLIVVMVLSTAGLGMWLTAMAVQYRDISYASPFVIQILMYLAPVVYPAARVPAEYRLLYGLNPMAGVIEGFRSALLGTGAMPWDLIGVGSAVSVALAVSGAFVFRRMERLFADVA